MGANLFLEPYDSFDFRPQAHHWRPFVFIRG